ncbi:MAG: CBS domain-containing protein [Acidiferrobacterales bacterium]
MQVKDVMRTEVKSVELGTSVKEAFDIMRKGRFRHLPVLDSGGKIAGIVSDRDLRNVLVIYRDPGTGAENFFATDDTTVDKIMVADPVSVAPDDDVAAAVKLIRDQQFGCLIVSENDRLVGILSYVDLLDVLLKLLNGPDQEIST